MSKPKLFLIDASPIFYKAFFAIPPLSSRNGVPTNAVYGFTSTLIKILKTYNPQHIVICFDQKSKYRKELYSDYKADRENMKDDLKVQIPILKELISAMGIRIAELSGYEADDLIGMLAKWGEAQGADVAIISPDKDMSQLVNDNIKILELGKKGIPDRYLGKDEIKVKFELYPEHIVDLLALSGDQSDGIPGVKGIGEKTAVKLIQKFGSVEQIYEKIDLVEGANKKKLVDGKDVCLISKKLATIITEMKLDYKTMFDVERGMIEFEKVKSKFDSLNILRLKDRLTELE